MSKVTPSLSSQEVSSPPTLCINDNDSYGKDATGLAFKKVESPDESPFDGYSDAEDGSHSHHYDHFSGNSYSNHEVRGHIPGNHNIRGHIPGNKD